jgi:hypothetical protein
MMPAAIILGALLQLLATILGGRSWLAKVRLETERDVELAKLRLERERARGFSDATAKDAADRLVALEKRCDDMRQQIGSIEMRGALRR